MVYILFVGTTWVVLLCVCERLLLHLALSASCQRFHRIFLQFETANIANFPPSWRCNSMSLHMSEHRVTPLKLRLWKQLQSLLFPFPVIFYHPNPSISELSIQYLTPTAACRCDSQATAPGGMLIKRRIKLVIHGSS